MGQKMSLQSRREWLSRIGGRYRESNRKEKQNILDEFVVSAGYGRKYAVTLLNHGARSQEAQLKTRRPRLYDDRVLEALVGVWRAANRICSKRLVPFLPEFVPARWWHHLFHNQRALLIKGALLFKPNIVVTSVPFHLKH